ncbi:MAG: hypothetical protein HOG03_24300 [Desulfobacula sp.]|nr:hypothetical protein [Desulfobacula sp.]MBT4027756.1 hypothetical protein [Desulfobacula sp.]MBT6341394.1 hypothetical protein [Desulfobacula sp.]MBT6749222.1 hypothetical protein [Desulfobacula sp.]MBT7052323.1 hypothetical protein [Desulfobacula sp.]
MGSGTCVPSLKRNSCSALVRGKSSHILLDAGPGTMGQLLKLGIQLDYTKVYHKPESLAYRLTDKAGFSVVYSGDTDFCEPLIDLSRKTDILICESAFPDGKKVSGHLTPSIAGEIAAKARVRKLVLTHFYPVCDDFDIKAQCRNTFTGPLVLAEDLLNL